MIRIHDTATDTVIDRDMTDDEYAQHLQELEAINIKLQKQAEQEAAKESARAKLAALGLTDEEVAALIP